jgi:phage-related baseplate assembly protein
MAGSFTAVDLSKLAAPAIVEALSFETIFNAMLADLVSRDPTFSALVESDPAYKVLEVCAYRELLMRQRVNEAARAIMPAFAAGSDLDHIAARVDVERLLLVAGDDTVVPPVAPVYESDSDLRRRMQLAFEGVTTAGPEGAYIFHALGASSDVLDVAVANPPLTPGTVNVAVLSRTGTGAAPAGTLTAVNNVLSSEDVRPLCDTVVVASAAIVNYAITAALTFYPGAGQDVAMQAAQAGAAAYAADMHALGRDITLSGVYAALHVPGVQKVALSSPGADVVIAWNQAANCTAITLTNAGTNE